MGSACALRVIGGASEIVILALASDEDQQRWAVATCARTGTSFRNVVDAPRSPGGLQSGSSKPGGIAVSILIRFAPASLTAQQYDESVRKLEEAGDWPADGLDYHVCFGSDPNLRVSEIWDSREQLEAFGERLMPVLAEVGIEPGQPEVMEIHNIVRR
jgi:hypothetical protein